MSSQNKEIINPWKNVSGPNFLFEKDKKIIEDFNKSLPKHPHYIDLDLMPEPYIGNPNANVILLLTNPGLKGNEKDNYNNFPGYKEALEKNLKHENHDTPYYYFNPEFQGTDGGKWIRQRMKKLIEALGEKELSKKIFTIQLHPYHSNGFKQFKDKFEGHDYSMYLLSKAIERKALFIFTRSHKEWNAAYKRFDSSVKDLKEIIGDNFIQLKTPNKEATPRTPYFIESYMGKANFDKLIAKLKEPL